LRLQLRRDLALPGLPKGESAHAVIVSLLDATWLRIGNDEYARDNDSYGLTTLKNRHVQFIRDGRLLSDSAARGGADHELQSTTSVWPKLVRRRCHQLPGQRLFQYVDEDGGRHPIDSDQVSAYLRDVMGADFTAKDFRTWGATLRAIALMAATPLAGRQASER
jgi:DNA topoisomerase IB